MSSMTYNETLIRLADNDIGVTATSDVPEPIQETKTTTYNKVSGQFASGSDNASNYKYIYAPQTYVPTEDIILTSYGICDGHGSQTTDPMQGGYVFIKEVINPAKLAMRKDADGEWIVNDTGYTKFSKSESGPTVLQFNGTSMDDGVFV